MTAHVRMSADFQSRRKNIRSSVTRSLKKREPLIGFAVGLVGILTILGSVLAWYGQDGSAFWP